MKLTPRTLVNAAWIAIVAPAAMGIVSQLIILAIPGCDPSPYATEGCVVAGQEIGGYLAAGLLIGPFLAVAAAGLISTPLLVASVAWSWIRRRSLGKAS